MNVYTKLKDGTWGIKVEGSASAGIVVNVITKAGQLKKEIVGKVLWQGKDKFTGKQVALCTKQFVQQRQSRHNNANEGWRNNGCSECRRRGDWCDSCAFDEFDN